jgi:hypothetical protein
MKRHFLLLRSDALPTAQHDNKKTVSLSKVAKADQKKGCSGKYLAN